MPAKRKHVYLESYEKEFRHIKKSRKGEEFAHCVVCNDDINLLSIGKSAISLHQKTGKHQKAAKAANRSIPLQEFLPNTSVPSTEDRKILAAEGAWAYHTAQHSHSFNSVDCVSSSGLFRTIFPDSAIAKKFSCARIKTAKILTGVLAPYSTKNLLARLGNQPFSLSIDASNFGHEKLFPLVLRFFTKCNGIETRLLDLEALPGESSIEVHQWITKIVEKHNLDFSNLTAFSADNTKSNFGGEERRGENNVFFRLRQQQERLIGVGCVCHILHNSAKRATDNLRIAGNALDIEAVVFKLAGHFKNSTLRTEELKGFCDELEVGFERLNRHGPTRWTTMHNVLGKIIRLESVLVAYFSKPEKCPALLYDFFFKYSEQSFAVVHFLHHVLGIFNKTIDFFQQEKIILPELLSEMEKFRSKIEFRKRERFFGADLGLAKVEQHARKSLEEQFLAFYTTVLDYLDKWFRVDRFPEKLRWVSLMSDKIPHNDALDLARQIAPDLTNNLFDDVSEANQILNSIPKDELQKLNPEQKWMKLFEADLPHLYKLVSIVLSVPVSNAFVERVFSLCGSQWTDVRNSLKVETVKALVQTKINFDLTCPEMYQMLISNRKLLDQIGGWDKYFE